MSVLSDLFAAMGLGRACVVPAGLSFSIGGVSNIWWGIVMMIVYAMSSMMSCAGVPVRNYVVLKYWYMWFEFYDAQLGQKWNDVLYMPDRYAYGRVGDWEWVDMMALYCRNAAEEDNEFARRVGVLLEEMEAAYKERVDFIKELKAVPDVDAAVKTAELLNHVLWNNEMRLQRLCRLRMDADLMAYDKENFAEKR
ncbi:hypothetical protein Tco_0897221 [Tanacetum coccineum]